MSKDYTWYLAGPMTGYRKENLPSFMVAAAALRSQGFNIISPAELDGTDVVQAVLNGSAKTFNELAGLTWGETLARDVRLIADVCDGIIFLDGWEKSKGARLEAFVGVLNGSDFATYLPKGFIQGMTSQMVLTKIMRYTSQDLRDALNKDLIQNG